MIFTAEEIAQLVVSVGLPLATQLMTAIENKTTFTAAQFLALVTTYGTKTAAQYLADAQNASKLTTSIPLAP